MDTNSFESANMGAGRSLIKIISEYKAPIADDKTIRHVAHSLFAKYEVKRKSKKDKKKLIISKTST